MCGSSTGKRRRRQAAMGYTHLAKLGRPIYGKRSKEKSARMLAQRIATERRIKAKGGK